MGLQLLLHVSIRSSLVVGFTGVALAAALAPAQAQTCQFLAPVGGNGTTNDGMYCGRSFRKRLAIKNT